MPKPSKRAADPTELETSPMLARQHHQSRTPDNAHENIPLDADEPPHPLDEVAEHPTGANMALGYDAAWGEGHPYTSPEQASGKKAKKGKKSKKGHTRTGPDTATGPASAFHVAQGGLVISTMHYDGEGALYDAEAITSTGAGAGTAAGSTKSQHPAWRYVMYCLVIGPWKVVRGLGWLLGRWQRVMRPFSVALFHISDKMDKYMPTVHALCIWSWNWVSLLLHFLSVYLTYGVFKMLWTHEHKGMAMAIIIFYGISHYLMGCIMYMEMDRITNAGRYNAPEFGSWLNRLVDVLFWDMQLVASVVHSNCMLGGLTQMLLKGYEEARVCIHALVNTLPMIIILAIIYDGVALRWIQLDFGTLDENLASIQHTTYEERVWLAFVFSIFNMLEKLLRCSLADPWLHPDNKDYYPLAYMRSNAARLPHGLMLEWLFRCNLQLSQQQDELVLRDLFAIYTFNCKGDARELCDGHKAHLLRKALRTFNGSSKPHQVEVIAQRLDKSKFRNPRSIQALDASNIHPGRYMSGMLGDILGDSVGYSALNLGHNMLGDVAINSIMECLRANKLLQLRVLILSCNDIGEQGCHAIAKLAADSRSLSQLVLSGNPLGDAGAKVLSDALSGNNSLLKLDLSNSSLGADAGPALGGMLKSNHTLVELKLAGAPLGTAGVEAIAKGLRNNTGLQLLDVSATGADDKAAMAFAQALSTNKALTHLDLSHTGISDEGAKALCDVLQYNTKLQVCELVGCNADRSWMKLMSNIVSSRPTKS